MGISQLTHLKASGFDACFHDGNESRLRAVDEFHKHLLESTTRNDLVSSCMSEIILGYMLTKHQQRPPAIHVKTYAEDHIQSSLRMLPIDEGLTTQEVRQGQILQHFRAHRGSVSGSLGQGHEVISVERVYEILETTRRRIFKLDRSQGKVSEVMKLAGIQEARSKIQAHGGRHQVGQPVQTWYLGLVAN